MDVGADQALPEETDAIVRAALAEDVGPGDLTTEATIPAELSCDAIVVAKEACTVCGLPVARKVFQMLDPGVSLEALVPVDKALQRVQEDLELALLDELEVDLVVMARYMQILSGEFLEHVRCRVINIHHSSCRPSRAASPITRRIGAA